MLIPLAQISLLEAGQPASLGLAPAETALDCLQGSGLE